MELKNKHKVLYYYATGAFILLLLLKLFTSKFFEDLVDFSITFLPFIIIILTVAVGVVRYKKHPENLEAIKKKTLHETLYLLLITLLFYILYSPGSFEPIVVSIKKIGQLFSMENYFLVLSYISVGIISFSLIYVFVKLYQKSKGTFDGSVRDVAHHALYSVFFVMAFLFISSIFTYPRAYAPVTSAVSGVLYRLFYSSADRVAEVDPRVDSKVRSLKEVISDTFDNLKNNVSTTNETLVTTITETKSTLDNAISRTNKDLKTQLVSDIEDRLDLSGGTLSGNLTIEDKLTVEDTSTVRDILPHTDDSYDLGSISRGWNNVYIHTLHGSSILTVGDGSTSHGMTDSDDLLVSGDFEVNGTSYLDGAINLNGTVTFGGTINAGSNRITNLADPTDAQDAVTKAYYLANTPTGVLTRTGTTLSPTTAGDALDMGSGAITGGALALSGVITASSTSAHTLGPITMTNGAVAGVTSLGMGGALSGVTTLGMGGALSGVTSLSMGGALSGVTTLGMSGALSASSGSAHTLGSLTVTGGAVTGITSLNTDISANELGRLDGVSSNIQDQIDAKLSKSGGTMTGSISMGNSYLLTDIGNAATDFTSGGGLNLAGNLSANGSSNTIAGTLNLSGGALTSTGALTVTPASGSNLNVALATTGDFAVNTSQFYVDTSSGYIGIGDTTPDDLLNIHSASAAAGLAITSLGTDTDSYLKFELADGTPSIMIGVDDTDSDRFKISTGTSLGLNDAMIIDPATGITYINSLQSGAQSFPDNAGVTQWVDLGVTTAVATAGTVESYSAMLDGAAVLTIYGTAGAGTGTITDDTIGVGIGTTAPGAMLHVYDDKASDYVGEFYNDGNNANRYGLSIWAGADSGGTGTLIQFGDGDGTDVGEITYSGTTTTYSTSSDIRMKKNIRATSRGLEDLMRIKVRDYEFKDEYGDPNSYTGYVAQELAVVYPEAVSSYSDGRMWGVDYGKITPLIIKAVQEQQGQISTIVTNNTAQTTDINGLVLKTNTNATTVAGLQKSVDEQLKVIGGQLAVNTGVIDGNSAKISELAAQIASIEVNTDAAVIADIQDQMETIQEEYQALMGSVIALNLENLIYKDSFGNVDLLEGKLVAKETETGKLTIAVADEASATIGAGEIAAGEKETEIATSAVAENSKIFVTFKSDLRGRSWHIPEAGIKPEESFTVAVSDKALAGTIALTADSATVEGTGTSFAADLAAGDKIVVGEDSYEVKEVKSDTELVLTEKYAGENVEGLRAEAISGKDLKFDWWIVGVNEATVAE